MPTSAALREQAQPARPWQRSDPAIWAPANVLIRLEEQPGGEKPQQAALKKVSDATEADFTQRRVEVVGPAVSSELRMTGFIAVAAGILAIVAYVWFRFEWQFAVGAVVALTHDVLVTAGIFSLFQFEFDLLDRRRASDHSRLFGERHGRRVRPHSRKFAQVQENGAERASQSVDQRDAIAYDPDGHDGDRSALSLYIFGGEVIRNFNFAMLLGVVIGTYSSIFIAAPLLGYFGVKRDWSDAAAKGVAAAKTKAKA